MTTSTTFRIDRRPDPTPDERRAEILAEPGFGVYFTDHMVNASWRKGEGWVDLAVRPYAPLQLDPAAAVLHYAQEVFEGLKAYRHADGSVWSFRPEANAARFARSARRLALPELAADLFLESLQALVEVDNDWVPSGGETSLYLRPFMFASESFLGVRPANQVSYLLIASPAGSYFASGVKPVSIWLSQEYTRAAPGGTGFAKCGGNYAASLVAQSEAYENGCDQVCFLDATEHRWVEELGGMNLFFVYDDGSVVTPPVSGTILEGITRSSIITLLGERGHSVREERVSIDTWRADAASGRLAEVFACGTAAVITPVGRLIEPDAEHKAAGTGELTMSLRSELLDIQYGRAEDRHGWLRRLA